MSFEQLFADKYYETLIRLHRDVSSFNNHFLVTNSFTNIVDYPVYKQVLPYSIGLNKYAHSTNKYKPKPNPSKYFYNI